MGTRNSSCIIGQAEPRRASGSPKLMKERYIISNKQENMNSPYFPDFTRSSRKIPFVIKKAIPAEKMSLIGCDI